MTLWLCTISMNSTRHRPASRRSSQDGPTWPAWASKASTPNSTSPQVSAPSVFRTGSLLVPSMLGRRSCTCVSCLCGCALCHCLCHSHSSFLNCIRASWTFSPALPSCRPHTSGARSFQRAVFAKVFIMPKWKVCKRSKHSTPDKVMPRAGSHNGHRCWVSVSEEVRQKVARTLACTGIVIVSNAPTSRRESLGSTRSPAMTPKSGKEGVNARPRLPLLRLTPQVGLDPL